VISLELSADDCDLIGEALAGQCMHYETVAQALRSAADVEPETGKHASAYIEGKLRALRTLHVTVINARTKGV
jgi:hypothetical protein